MYLQTQTVLAKILDAENCYYRDIVINSVLNYRRRVYIPTSVRI